MARRDLYEVLGVPRDAGDGDIKKAFRRLARQYHPDVNRDDPEAGERFREAAEAYEVLSNPETRGRYDRYGHAGIDPSQIHAERFTDFGTLSDLLGAFFGDDLFGGAAARGPARGADVTVATEITLAEAATGARRELDLEIVAVCERCRGDGSEPGSGAERCPACGGAGRVSHVSSSLFGQFVQTGACAACSGRGVRITDPCRECRGRGRRPVRRQVEVDIPAGIFDGQRLRLTGRGHEGEPGAPAGDLYVRVAVAEDERFARDGHDVVSRLDVTFAQAALGGTVTVETLAGEETVELPAGSQPGDVVTLRDRGMPVLGGRGRGDQRVVVNVRVPRRLSPEQRELLERFEQATGGDAYEADESLLGRLRSAFR